MISYPADFSSSSIFKGFQKKLTQAFFSFVFWMVSHTGSPSLVHFTSTRRDCKCTTTSLPLHPSVTLNHQVTLVLMAWPRQSSDWMVGGLVWRVMVWFITANVVCPATLGNERPRGASKSTLPTARQRGTVAQRRLSILTVSVCWAQLQMNT